MGHHLMAIFLFPLRTPWPIHRVIGELDDEIPSCLRRASGRITKGLEVQIRLSLHSKCSSLLVVSLHSRDKRGRVSRFEMLLNQGEVNLELSAWYTEQNWVYRRCKGVSWICFARSKAVERSPSFSTSTRPITSTELFGEEICFIPLGTGPFQPGPVMI